MTAQTLLNALEQSGMVEIDGLHAFEFFLDEDDNLHIECIDGRAAKHWEFTPVQVAAATFDDSLQSWLIVGYFNETKAIGEHRLVCHGDVVSSSDDEDDNLMKMRKFWPLLMAGSVGAMGLSSASAESFQLLVGSYTANTSQGIYRMNFDSATGQIDAKPLQVVKSENPSWLTLSKDQHRLFVVNENGPGQKDPVGRVSSYSIDPKTHALTLINQVQSLGNEPTHSSLSGDASHLFVSNYSVMEDPGGTLAVLPVGADGKLKPVVQMSAHPASRVNPERQASNHVHSTVSSPDGRYVFSNDLGADKVFIYQFDPKANPDLPLTPAKTASVPCQPAAARVICCSALMANTPG